MKTKTINKKKAKEVVGKTATKTVTYTIHAIKLIFIILIIYITGITVYGYLSTGQEFLTTVATLSVGGFWAFFFGYFGWRLGQSIEEYFLEISKKE
jgi:hypothetical protein